MTMPRERFRLILRFPRFDDLPIRLVLDSVVDAIKSSYTPNKFVTIDEHLCRYRGKCPFRQYMLMKPDKYGIKIFVIADAKNYYLFNVEIYAVNKSKISKKPKDLVLRLASTLVPGHCLVGDNYFSSMSLCNNLLNERGYTYFGTMRRNRREVPRYLFTVKGLSVHSSTFLFSGNCTLVSYAGVVNMLLTAILAVCC